VELGAEAFTLAQLDAWQRTTPTDSEAREHLTLLSPVPPPPIGPGAWTVDAPEDYEAARRRVGDA
jgi:hypothetical protein